MVLVEFLNTLPLLEYILFPPTTKKKQPKRDRFSPRGNHLFNAKSKKIETIRIRYEKGRCITATPFLKLKLKIFMIPYFVDRDFSLSTYFTLSYPQIHSGSFYSWRLSGTTHIR